MHTHCLERFLFELAFEPGREAEEVDVAACCGEEEDEGDEDGC